ncbi:MAG: membrane dipeptidase [bacterium]|nr:membrane dipeptidase [bacterium]
MTPTPDPIDTFWEAGLDCLKPAQKDLDHGLEVHGEALVFELYGFAPKLAPNPDTINAAIDGGNPPDHVDELTAAGRVLAFLDKPETREIYARAWERAGVDCMFFNVAGMDRPPVFLMRQIARHIHVTDELDDTVQRITRPDQVLDAKRNGKRGIILGSNDVPLASEGESVPRELRYVSTLYHLGCRTMHLTYNRRNLIGDGCMERSDAGLSDFGHAAIAELNRYGILADVAHSGHQTSFDAARASSQPIVASHTGATALHDHPRNKPDDVLKAIAEDGGVIGVVALPDFIGRSGDLNAVLDHIDYITQLVGVDHVAIGMDRSYSAPNLGASIAQVHPKPPPPFYELWQRGTLGNPRYGHQNMRASTAWTNWPLITVGLVQRGYTDEDIRKIIGENTLRIWRDVYRETAPVF